MQRTILWYIFENGYHYFFETKNLVMLKIQQLSVKYHGLQALDAISFQLKVGQVVGLIGPNGAGKSTLFKALLGLIPAVTGQVFYHDKLLKFQKNLVAYLPQRSQIDWDFPITVWNVVMMARTAHTGWFQAPSARSKEIVKTALDKVEMLHLRHRRISDLSGGQQQRVFLARALAQEAELFLLDEPLSGVDKKTEALILKIYLELKAAGKTLFVSCHEWGQALDCYDQLVLLNQSLIACGSPQEVLTAQNIKSAFGMQLPQKPLEMAFNC